MGTLVIVWGSFGKDDCFDLALINIQPCIVSNILNVLICRPDEQVIPKEDPLVHEISDVLHEWSLVWKKLYAVSQLSPQ